MPYYCSYFLIAALQSMGVDIVFRLHGARDADFRVGKKLGKNDHIVTYHRPKKPDWMDMDSYKDIA